MCTFLRFRLHHVLIRLVFPIRVVAFFFLFILHDVPSIFILCLQDLIGNSGRRDKFLAFNKLFNPLQRKRNTKREGKQKESCQETTIKYYKWTSISVFDLPANVSFFLRMVLFRVARVQVLSSKQRARRPKTERLRFQEEVSIGPVGCPFCPVPRHCPCCLTRLVVDPFHARLRVAKKLAALFDRSGNKKMSLYLGQHTCPILQ